MKQQKLVGYQPIYPRKALRSAALTAAALVAIAGAAGCQKPEPQVMGMMEILTPPPEELVLDGEVAIAEPEPTPEMLLQTTGVLLAPTATPEA